MEIPLRGWVWPPATKNGNRLKVLLLNSYFTRAQIKPEERKTEERLERKVVDSIPTDAEVILAILCFGNLAIMMKIDSFAY